MSLFDIERTVVRNLSENKKIRDRRRKPMRNNRREDAPTSPERRRLFGLLSKVLFVGGVAAAGGYGLFKGLDRDIQREGALKGQPIEPRYKGEFEGPYLTVEGAIIRSDTTQDNGSIIGYTTKGYPVDNVRAIHGSVYGSEPLSLGKFPGKDGAEYGTWYDVKNPLPVFDKVDDKLVPRIDESGQQVMAIGKLAGNWLEIDKSQIKAADAGQ